MNRPNTFPRQNLPSSQKTKAWRESCVKWAEGVIWSNSNKIRNSIGAKRVNYDLMNGILSMKDLDMILNPYGDKEDTVLQRIQHYPLINSKIDVLRGEESKRTFDYRVVVTNPNAITEIEEAKKNLIRNKLMLLLEEIKDPQQYEEGLRRLSDFSMSFQDIKEKRGNYLLSHYSREYNFPYIFNQGFYDGLTVGEEIYKCYIVSGEPIIEKVNPCDIVILRTSNSSKIEDADVIIYRKYMSPGSIIDNYYDVLTKAEVDKIEKGLYADDEYASPISSGPYFQREYFIDRANGFKDGYNINNILNHFSDSIDAFSINDADGNIRVLEVYWKSRKMIKKVEWIDPTTGEEITEYYSEDFQEDESLGQKVTKHYINEAWEGTLIGNDIFVNIRPMPIQYNRLFNPSRCHFGFVGSIYNINDSKPFSLVDRLKPYNYLYDVIKDKLNKDIIDNWGKIITLDLAKVPKGWDVAKWVEHAKKNKLAVVDSFREGNNGAATGKLAGGLNNNTSGTIDAEMGQSIQTNIQLLSYIKEEMSEVSGINRQREGQTFSRETVGGIERATLQSSYITEYLFLIHDDVKKRVLECFLETAKHAIRGKSLKFSHVLPDSALMIADIDGDEFSENDYGLIVDASSDTQLYAQRLESLAQAALQNGLLDFSTMLKLYSSASLAEKQKMVEDAEAKKQEQMQQQMQMQQQLQQEQLQAQREAELAKQDHELNMAREANETKVLIAQINAEAGNQRAAITTFRIDDDEFSEEERLTLAQAKKEFEEKMAFEKEKFNKELALKKEQLTLQREASKKKNTNN